MADTADSTTPTELPRLAVVGTGYLGATHAAAMAELGMPVIGVDTDQAKYEAVGFLGQHTIDGTTYYYYGSTSHTGGYNGSYTSTYSGPALHM